MRGRRFFGRGADGVGTAQQRGEGFRFGYRWHQGRDRRSGNVPPSSGIAGLPSGLGLALGQLDYAGA